MFYVHKCMPTQVYKFDSISTAILAEIKEPMVVKNKYYTETPSIEDFNHSNIKPQKWNVLEIWGIEDNNKKKIDIEKTWRNTTLLVYNSVHDSFFLFLSLTI